MTEQITIGLDCIAYHGGDGNSVRLVKHMSESYKARTFGEMLDNISNSMPDDLNAQGYVNDQKRAAEWLSISLSDAVRSSQSLIQLTALSNDGSSNEIHVGLDDVVGDYCSQVLFTEKLRKPADFNPPYDSILLYLREANVSGY